MKKLTIKEALYTDKISRIGSVFRCSECNFSHGTPFEALKCYKKCAEEEKIKKEKDPINIFWKSLSDSERRDLRKKFNNSENYSKFENVAHWAFQKK